MDKRKTRDLAALGALALVAAILFIWGMYYLLGTPMLRSGTDVVVALDDGAGLRRGDRVQLQGVDVGSVTSVELVPPHVFVELRLRDGLLLPADTRATITGDVFGAHSVVLLRGTAPDRLADGDTIRGAAAAGLPELATGLGERAQHLFARVDTLLSVRAAADLHATAALLPGTAQEMLATFTELRHAAASMRRTAQDVEAVRSGDALVSALGEFEASARALTSAVGAMERSMGSIANVADRIDQGEGTLGRLVNDPELYISFHEALREVRFLAADIRERPRRYFEIRIF